MIKKNDICYFHHEGYNKMLKILQNLHCKNVTQQGDTPITTIKENKFVSSEIQYQFVNVYIDNNAFSQWPEKVDINPVYKKFDSFEKTNYMPISILPVLSKCFKYFLYDQIHGFIEKIIEGSMQF